MFAGIADMFSYAFMTRALVGGALIALCAALLGVTLVLRRYAMIGDGLSHVGFGALSVAAAMNVAPLAVAVPVVVVAAFALLRVSGSRKVMGDAAIALISTVALAAGVIVTSVAEGVNVDVYSYMFGSILAMSDADVVLAVCLGALVLVLFMLFYGQIFAVTFDERFARATGVKTGLYNALIALLTALTVVVGMRMMGTLLISSLIIFPALTSMRVFRSFRGVVLSSACVALIAFFAGIVCSYLFDIPAGASIVAANAACFAIFAAVGALRERRVAAEMRET